MKALRFLLAGCVAFYLVGLAGHICLAESISEQKPRLAMLLLLQEMRQQAERQRPGVIFVGNNGLELILSEDGKLNTGSNLFEGMLLESFFYGADMEDNKATPEEHRLYLQQSLRLFQQAGKTVFNIDYVSDSSLARRAYRQNREWEIVPMISKERGLQAPPGAEAFCPSLSTREVTFLRQAKSLFVLLNPGRFANKEQFLKAMAGTNYDVLIVDPQYMGTYLQTEDVARLQKKESGERRLVLAYLSVGEAETYRDYWQESWKNQPPSWLLEANPNWEENYRVRYWEEGWKDLLYKAPGSRLQRILTSGFDGVFLDVIDAYQVFEAEERKEIVE